MIIRSEKTEDYTQISEVIRSAFKQEEEEVILVDNLRKSPDFIPELSLVAIIEGKIIGHILFSKVIIKSDLSEHDVLCLAPVSVHSKFQNKGIGTELVQKGLEECKRLGYGIVNVLGHENYYPRFGFKLAKEFKILPIEKEWENNFFIIELISGALNGVAGTLVYPPEFNAAL